MKKINIILNCIVITIIILNMSIYKMSSDENTRKILIIVFSCIGLVSIILNLYFGIKNKKNK